MKRSIWLSVALVTVFAASPLTAEECKVNKQDATIEQADDLEACLKGMRRLYLKCTAPWPTANVVLSDDCLEIDLFDLEEMKDDYKKGYRQLLRLDRKRVIMDKVVPDRIDKGR